VDQSLYLRPAWITNPAKASPISVPTPFARLPANGQKSKTSKGFKITGYRYTYSYVKKQHTLKSLNKESKPDLICINTIFNPQKELTD
jgi:hypothetical protein